MERLRDRPALDSARGPLRILMAAILRSSLAVPAADDGRCTGRRAGPAASAGRALFARGQGAQGRSSRRSRAGLPRRPQRRRRPRLHPPQSRDRPSAPRPACGRGRGVPHRGAAGPRVRTGAAAGGREPGRAGTAGGRDRRARSRSRPDATRGRTPPATRRCRRAPRRPARASSPSTARSSRSPRATRNTPTGWARPISGCRSGRTSDPGHRPALGPPQPGARARIPPAGAARSRAGRPSRRPPPAIPRSPRSASPLPAFTSMRDDGTAPRGRLSASWPSCRRAARPVSSRRGLTRHALRASALSDGHAGFDTNPPHGVGGGRQRRRRAWHKRRRHVPTSRPSRVSRLPPAPRRPPAAAASWIAPSRRATGTGPRRCSSPRSNASRTPRTC